MLWTHAAMALVLLMLLGCSGFTASTGYDFEASTPERAEPVAMGLRRLRPKAKPSTSKQSPPAESPSQATQPANPSELKPSTSNPAPAAKSPAQATQPSAPTADRKKLLGADPKKGHIEYEGQVGADIEQRFGGFKRDPSGNGEWISLSGPYKGKSFDLLGIPPDKARFHGPKLERFLPSVDAHFRKSIEHIVLDVRNMTAEQRKTVLNYIDTKWKAQKHRLIILSNP